MAKRLLIAAGVFVALVLAGCGGGEPLPETPPGAALLTPGADTAGGDDLDIGGDTDNGIDADSPVAAATADEARATTPPVAGGMPTMPPGLTRRGNAEEEEEATEEPAEDDEEEAVSGEAATIEVTDAGSVRAAWEEVYALEPGTPFTLVMTDAAFEAYLAEEIGASDPGDMISDVSVSIEDTMLVAFVFTVPGLGTEVDAELEFDIYATEGGTITVDMVAARAGDQELPPEVTGVFSQSLEPAVSGDYDFTGVQGNVSFTDVTMGDGQLTISGVREG